MPVSAADFLLSAENLLAQGTEIDWRNAASRAYYSAFHYCTKISDELDKVKTNSSGMHRSFIESFTGNASLKVKAIGYMLQQCYDTRLIADYELNETFSQNVAKATVQQVRAIFTKVDELA